jgi:hypothetical protein
MTFGLESVTYENTNKLLGSKAGNGTGTGFTNMQNL